VRDTRKVSDREGETQAERKGQERAEAAHARLEHARERARVARKEAAALHDTAEKLQRHHVEEAREPEDEEPTPVADDAEGGDTG
jgi:hypothetical protein